jgi:heme-degrading monooxygenase HmoA
MNRFQVVPAKEREWERIWKDRETYLQEVPGFVQFALLRGDDEGDYISHSIWRDRTAFDAWTRSEAFSKGHAQGSLQGILAGPPQLGLFQAVIREEPNGERELDESEPVAGRRGPRH